MTRRTLTWCMLGLTLAASACTTCPPGIAENKANVEAITKENTAANAGLPESVRAAKDLRNEHALRLAATLEEACQ